MKFVLYSLNYSPELTGIGKYNGELGKSMPDYGVDVSVITAPPYYPEWQVHSGFANHYSTQRDSGVTIYRNPLYVPKRVSTIKRLVHLASFALSSFGRLLTLLTKKPDVVFVVQPTLFCVPGALIFCWLTGAKTIMHIQDYEVDAMFGLGMVGNAADSQHSSPSMAKRVALGIERMLMPRFDCVSSISHSMLARAEQKGVDKDKLLFFPNWADTSFVSPEVSGAELKAQWGYQPDDKIVLYSGNIGNKQGLEIVIQAADALKSRASAKFIIIGNGSYRDELEAQAQRLGLNNIRFLPLQAWELVPQILRMADIHLVVQKKGVADAVLPSKLTNILAAGGHALVTGESDTELGKIARLYPGIYRLVEPENTSVFIEALEQMLDSDTRVINQIARDYAVENINKDKVIGRFVENLQQIIESGKVPQ